MAEKKNILTEEGLAKLEDELQDLKVNRRKEVAVKIKEAREQGDLSENAEYDAAKEEQSQNESKIAEIRQTLSVARVVEDAQHGGIRVSIGTTVELEDERGKKTKFTIVGTTETNSLEHKISNESPAGQALIGCGKGDQVEFTTPAGKTKSYTIVSITR